MNGGRILVIEDNAKNLKLVRDVLSHDGYEVIEARNAEDGIALAEEQLPDLVLMDIQLPGMDGMEALKVLKGSDRGSSVPIVAVTAFAMKDDRARALDAGFDDYLEKPISLHALREVVHGYLPGRDGHDG